MEPQLFNTLMQGSALAILAYHFLWDLPALFREIRDERKETREAHEKQMDSIHKSFFAETARERETCERRHSENLIRQDKYNTEAAQRHDEAMLDLTSTRHEVKGLAQLVSSKNQVIDVILGLKKPDGK